MCHPVLHRFSPRLLTFLWSEVTVLFANLNAVFRGFFFSYQLRFDEGNLAYSHAGPAMRGVLNHGVGAGNNVL